MIRNVISLLLLILVAKSDVIVLDDGNFTSFIASQPFVFVKFYAQQSSKCKTITNDYIKLAQNSKAKSYIIAEIQANVGKQSISELKIKQFPSLKFFIHGYSIQYSGERTADAMQNWIQNLILCQIKQINEEDFQKLNYKQSFVIVRGVSQKQLKELNIVQIITQVPFYSIKGSSLKIVLHLKNSKAEYKGELNVSQFSKWLLRKKVGNLVALTNQLTIKKVFQNDSELPAFLLLKNGDFSAQRFQILRSFCEKHDQQFKCAYADESHQIYFGLLRFFKTEDRQRSILAFLDYGIRNGYQVPNPTQLTSQSLSQFMQDISQGKIQKFYDQKKFKESKQPKYHNVLKLTNENFNQTLKDNKYVFVQYYSPTCEYCISFAPEYEALATKLKVQNSTFVIAAADLSQEDAIRGQVFANGYPTFRFYIEANQIDYNGERDADSIISFMRAATSSRLKTLQKKEDIKRPAIAVFGIDEHSPLHLLPLVFTRFPVYQILSESSPKVQIHADKWSSLMGHSDLEIVANWLEETAEPNIVDITASSISRKLSRAFKARIPLLVLINRDNSKTTKDAYNFLTNHCADKFEYLCGYASKQDPEYQNFNQWLASESTDSSQLVYIKTDTFEKFTYKRKLGKLRDDLVTQFVTNANAEKKGQHESNTMHLDITVPEQNVQKESQSGGQDHEL